MSKVIKLDSVSKEFSGQSVLSKVTFTIAAGDIATLYGPSGSGKSTILNLASGLDRPSQGQILIGNDRISDFDSREMTLYRRSHVGFIFQSYNLFSGLSAVENVEVISLLNGKNHKDAREHAKDALERVGLGQYADRFPGQLSGGQQQRVAVARAIASKPSVLFADEPTANLDSKTAKNIIELLFEMNKNFGTTILFSTHDNAIIEKVNTVIPVRDGIVTV